MIIWYLCFSAQLFEGDVRREKIVKAKNRRELDIYDVNPWTNETFHKANIFRGQGLGIRNKRVDQLRHVRFAHH